MHAALDEREHEEEAVLAGDARDLACVTHDAVGERRLYVLDILEADAGTQLQHAEGKEMLIRRVLLLSMLVRLLDKTPVRERHVLEKARDVRHRLGLEGKELPADCVPSASTLA